MSKKNHTELVGEDELPVIALDNKRRPAREISFGNTKGWKFYISVKELLPDWWYEFNGKVESSHKSSGFNSKYKNIEVFAKHKVKDKTERQFFIWMISPRKVWERNAKTGHKRYQVPWLGDWHARRRNGYWETENKEHIKSLRKAITENVQSGTAIRATSPFIVQSLLRWSRLADKVDELFKGEPFVDESPHSKNNIQRFKLYTSMHEQVEELKTKTIKEWMRIHGVDPNNPHEMADMATMAQLVGQSAAASALTGYSIGSSLSPQNGNDGKPNGNNVLSLNGQGIVISPDALLLAQHLAQHSTTFKKPLPSIIEGEELIKPKEKTNGHSKAN